VLGVCWGVFQSYQEERGEGEKQKELRVAWRGGGEIPIIFEIVWDYTEQAKRTLSVSRGREASSRVLPLGLVRTGRKSRGVHKPSLSKTKTPFLMRGPEGGSSLEGI